VGSRHMFLFTDVDSSGIGNQASRRVAQHHLVHPARMRRKTLQTKRTISMKKWMGRGELRHTV
jgi:hypothetical protein